MTEETNPPVGMPDGAPELTASTPSSDPPADEIAVRTHAQHVSDLASRLFDRTRSLHDLGDSSQKILAVAALIYNVPFPPGKKKPIRLARKMIAAQVYEEPFSKADQEVLAAVMALQHGQIKRKAVRRLDLSPMQEREALTLAALLRIAIGLDQGSSQQTVIERVELARGELWIAISGPEVEADAPAAQHNARLWAKIGYPPVKILLPAEAKARFLPYPERQEVVGMESGDTFAEAGRKVFRYHFAEMLHNEPGTRLGEDIEALHDMRVATRRMRAAFEVFGSAFEAQEMKHHLAGLRATGRALGTVRDLDVMIEKAERYRSQLPEAEQAGLEPLFAFWHAEREAARQRMLAYLDSQAYADFRREFNTFTGTPGSGARPVSDNPPEPRLVSEIAPILLFTRMAAVRAYGPFMAGAPLERYHALRIEFKKLRYTVEFFRDVLGEEAKTAIGQFKKIQDHLGDLNDAHVVSLLLEQFLAGWDGQQAQLPESERQDGSAIRAYEQAQLDEMEKLLASFQGVWDDFDVPAFRHGLTQALVVL
jgi:CHAD domain-containing protein